MPVRLLVFSDTGHDRAFGIANLERELEELVGLGDLLTGQDLCDHQLDLLKVLIGNQVLLRKDSLLLFLLGSCRGCSGSLIFGFKKLPFLLYINVREQGFALVYRTVRAIPS